MLTIKIIFTITIICIAYIAAMFLIDRFGY